MDVNADALVFFALERVGLVFAGRYGVGDELVLVVMKDDVTGFDRFEVVMPDGIDLGFEILVDELGLVRLIHPVRRRVRFTEIC